MTQKLYTDDLIEDIELLQDLKRERIEPAYPYIDVDIRSIAELYRIATIFQAYGYTFIVDGEYGRFIARKI